MKKIVHVAPYFYEYLAGQEKFVYNTCIELAKRGYEVIVLTSGKSPKREKLCKDDVCIEVLRVRRLITLFRTPITPSIIKDLMKVCNSKVLVHVHNPYHFQSIITALFKDVRNENIKLVLHEHGIPSLGYKMVDTLLRIYERTILRRILQCSDALIFLSRYSLKELMKKTLLHQIRKKIITVIPNGIPLNEFLIKASIIDTDLIKVFLKSKYGSEFDEKVKILFVGPVIKRKGIDVLLFAARKLVQEFNVRDFVIFIVGMGDEIRRTIEFICKNRLIEYIKVLGPISEDKLISLYKYVDVIVLPSRAEGVPTTIIEALALQKPVIASALPSVMEYFGEYIEPVPINNHVFLAKLLANVINEKSYLRRLEVKAFRAKEYILENFDLGKIASRIEMLYKIVLS